MITHVKIAFEATLHCTDGKISTSCILDKIKRISNQSVTISVVKKEIRVLLSEVEPKTVRLLVPILDN